MRPSQRVLRSSVHRRQSLGGRREEGGAPGSAGGRRRRPGGEAQQPAEKLKLGGEPGNKNAHFGPGFLITDLIILKCTFFFSSDFF